MNFLLDVNAVIALAYDFHVGHDKIRRWYAANRTSRLFLCSVVEMGFLRVSLNGGYRPSLALAQRALGDLSAAAGFRFLPDDARSASLPAYVTTARQITDGHLLALARRHGMELVTLDTGIPGSHLVA